MDATIIFHVRSLTRLRVSATQSRIEVNISSDADVENSDESLAFSVLVHHQRNPSPEEILSIALKRALDILATQCSITSKMN
jgi:hypothetical protein